MIEAFEILTGRGSGDAVLTADADKVELANLYRNCIEPASC